MSNYNSNSHLNQTQNASGVVTPIMATGFPGGSQIQNQLSGGGIQNAGQNSGNYSQQVQQHGGGGVSMQNMGFSQPGPANSPAPPTNSSGTNGTPANSGFGELGPGPGSAQALNPGSGPGPQPGQQQQQQQPQQKELNAASLCRFGQETAQELVNRGQEIFGCLRVLQPPDGRPLQPGADRKAKIHETVRNVKALFKRLRVIYEKIEESFPSSEIEEGEIEGLIPYEDELNVIDTDDRKNTDTYKLALEENRDIMEQVVTKNKHLKDTINHLRQIIWDVNTMLSMRKE